MIHFKTFIVPDILFYPFVYRPKCTILKEMKISIAFSPNFRQQEITLQLLESQALGTSSAFYLCPDTTTATATAAPVTTSQPAAHLMHTSLLVPPANPGGTPAGPSGLSVLPTAIPPAPTLPTSVPSQTCAAEADAIAMQAEALVAGTNKYVFSVKLIV